MLHRGLTTAAVVGLVVGCVGDAPAPALDVPQRPAEPSEVIFQAVDAGTGGALTDRQLTIRYLVRTPITLDTASVEQVSSAEPYRISHPVSTDSLVLEVRLEASSYFRQDTVLAVARGSSAGPFTLRMARRLDRVAQTPTRRPTGGGTPARPTPGGAAPAVTRPNPTRPPPPAGFDASAAAVGDRAFQRSDWSGARDAYVRMGTPSQRTGAEARTYAAALVRLGVSQMNLGAYGGAMEALEEAVDLPSGGYAARLHLGRAECYVGRINEGRATLAGVDDLDIPTAERPAALALVEYGRGLCSEGEFGQAESTIDRVRTGSRAIREFETFLQRGEALSPQSPELTAALVDARARIEDIRQRVRGGG